MKHRKHWPTRQSPKIPRLPKPLRPKAPLSSYLPRFSDLYSSSVYAAPLSLHNEKNQPCSCSCFSSVTNSDRIALQPNPPRFSPKALKFENSQIFEQRQDPDAAPSNANQESKKSRTASESVQKQVEICRGSEEQAHFCTGRVRLKTTRFFFETGPQRSRCVHPRPPDQRRRLAQLSLAIMNPMKFPHSSPEPLHSSKPWMILRLFRSSIPFSHGRILCFFLLLMDDTCVSSFIYLVLMDDTFVLLHTSTVFSCMCTWASSFIDLPLMDDSFVLLHLSTFFSWIGTSCFFIHPPSPHG